MRDTLLVDLGKMDILLNFWASLFFFMVLPTFWKWWRHHLGRALAALEILLLAAFTMPALGLMFSFNTDGKTYQWVTVAVLTAIPIRLFMLLGTLFWIQMSPLPLRTALAHYFRDLPGMLASPWIHGFRRLRGRGTEPPSQEELADSGGSLQGR